jgi:peptidoglycan lytic transglycosylase
MTARLLLTVATLLGLAGMSTAPDQALPGTAHGRSALSDSALDELAAGRFWHAARVMRAEGAADGSPRDVLTLARAEAGWENWPAVLALLDEDSWLSSEPEMEGYLLLGRAREYAGNWADAADAYAKYGAHVRSEGRAGWAALARETRTTWESGERMAALELLGEMRPVPYLRSWVAVELTLAASADGDPEGVRELIENAVEPGAASALWRAQADAYLNGGDTAAAVEAFRALANREQSGRAAEATVELGRLLMAGGDEAVGGTLLANGFDAGSGGTRTLAAAALMDLGGQDFVRTLVLARVLDRAGDGRRALTGYDRALSLSAAEGESFPEASRLERARLMSTVAARQAEALEEFRAIRDGTESDRVGSRNLEVWARMRRRQGMSTQENTLRRWLLEEYPSSNAAAEVAWNLGSNAEARGALDEALIRYAFLMDNVRTHARAGQARMRSGQIYLRRSDPAAAAEVFEAYLADFPNGRRWQEAAYWAGRTRLELGDTVSGERHLRHVLSQPVEYYAVMSADLLSVPFAVDVPEGAGASEPGWLTEGLVRLDVLTEAGLTRGVDAEIARLRSRAGDSRGPRLRLAQALIERGRTIDGINLGWALLKDEGAWDQQILQVTYPFPYRELVRREADEWGIDPFMMAAIIRQESAFKADIVSHAGAVGLMQVMPPTGAELARAHGPNGFTRESLTKPEVNLHLGAAFFVDMSRRYDDELPLVLSAYNAGPTRATRWRRYPEAGDPLRFTERIPITETRGYVKSVRRNLGLYRVLYGQD